MMDENERDACKHARVVHLTEEGLSCCVMMAINGMAINESNSSPVADPRERASGMWPVALRQGTMKWRTCTQPYIPFDTSFSFRICRLVALSQITTDT